MGLGAGSSCAPSEASTNPLPRPPHPLQNRRRHLHRRTRDRLRVHRQAFSPHGQRAGLEVRALSTKARVCRSSSPWAAGPRRRCRRLPAVPDASAFISDRALTITRRSESADISTCTGMILTVRPGTSRPYRRPSRSHRRHGRWHRQSSSRSRWHWPTSAPGRSRCPRSPSVNPRRPSRRLARRPA